MGGGEAMQQNEAPSPSAGYRRVRHISLLRRGDTEGDTNRDMEQRTVLRLSRAQARKFVSRPPALFAFVPGPEEA